MFSTKLPVVRFSRMGLPAALKKAFSGQNKRSFVWRWPISKDNFTNHSVTVTPGKGTKYHALTYFHTAFDFRESSRCSGIGVNLYVNSARLKRSRAQGKTCERNRQAYLDVFCTVILFIPNLQNRTCSATVIHSAFVLLVCTSSFYQLLFLTSVTHPDVVHR